MRIEVGKKYRMRPKSDFTWADNWQRGRFWDLRVVTVIANEGFPVYRDCPVGNAYRIVENDRWVHEAFLAPLEEEIEDILCDL